MNYKNDEFTLINNCYVIVDRFKEDTTYRYKLLICKEKNKEKYRIVNLTRGHICTCVFNTLKDVKEDLLENQRQRFLQILSVDYQ